MQDHPLAIGEGQTISAPHMHAICLELLEPHLQPGARVLDVGAGEGVCVCLCACEREREGECVCLCACVCTWCFVYIYRGMFVSQAVIEPLLF